MTCPTVKPGDEVWVWHFGRPIQVTVQEVTELQGRPAIIWPGYCSQKYFSTKAETYENRLMCLLQMAQNVALLKSKKNPRWEESFLEWIEVAKDFIDPTDQTD